MNGSLTDHEQGGFKKQRVYVDQIFTLKQISDYAQEKMQRVCGFYRFEEGVQ